MLTTDVMRAVLADVAYKDWDFHLNESRGSLYLQVRFFACDSETREKRLELQSGRKWLLSAHMTRSELVATALKAVLTAEEHESRAQFLYRGLSIFGPHLDIDALVEVAARKDRRSA